MLTSTIELPAADDAILAWGDVDGDEDTDIFAKEPGTGYRVLVNDGVAQFEEGWQMPDPRALLRGGVALGELDMDGDLDAVVTNGFQSTSHPTLVLLNDGSGRFADSGQQLGPTMAACG